MNANVFDAIKEEHDDFQEILLKYLDGEADESDIETLQDHLKRSKDHRDAFVSFARHHTAMFESIRENTETELNTNEAELEECEICSIIPKKNIFFTKTIKTIFAVAASILILVTVFLLPSSVVGKVVLSSNGATIIRDNKILPIENFSDLQKGDIIQTQDDFSLAYEDNSLVNLKGDSKIIIKGSSSDKKLFLEKGTLSAVVQPQNKDAPFQIETKNGTVEVVGTKFNLQAESEFTKIRVTKGKVMFGKERKVLINAGEAAIYSSGELKLYGLIDENIYSTIKEDSIFTFDLSKKIPESIKEHNEGDFVYSNFLDKTVFKYIGNKRPRNTWRSPHFQFSSEDALFSLSGDMIINFTIKTSCESHLEVGIINSSSSGETDTERIGVYLSGKLLDENSSKWQTLSLPIRSGKIYYNGKHIKEKEKELTEKLNTNEPLFLAKYIRFNTNIKNEGKNLEVSRIWITK